MTLFSRILLFWFMAIVSAVVFGFVLSKLWLWFLVPVGVNHITLVQGIGVGLIFCLLNTMPDRFRIMRTTDERPKAVDYLEMLLESTFFSGEILLLGYIIKSLFT